MTQESNKYNHNQAADPQFWDSRADGFDNEPDHGLKDPRVAAAWKTLLQDTLLPAPRVILDIGCGTGSLSVLLADLGYEVIGIDFSPEMIAKAREKAAVSSQSISFHLMDATAPDFAPEQFDALVCRHVLWALPDVSGVLQRWSNLLRPGGQMLLIEGFWHTGGGLHAQEIIEALPASISSASVKDLSDCNDYWGGAVNDERYAVSVRLPFH